MTSRGLERTWIRTGSYERFRGEWVKISLIVGGYPGLSNTACLHSGAWEHYTATNSRTPKNSSLDNSNSLLTASNKVTFPLDLTLLFCHFSWITPIPRLLELNFVCLYQHYLQLITRILVLAFHYKCHPIGFSCHVNKTHTTAFFLNKYKEQTTFSFPVLKMHIHVTVSDEVSFICTLMYTEVLKYQ